MNKIIDIELEKFLNTLISVPEINFTINVLNDLLNLKLQNVNNLEDGINILKELANNDEYKLMIIYTLLGRLEIITAGQTFLLELEHRKSKVSFDDITLQRIKNLSKSIRKYMLPWRIINDNNLNELKGIG